MAQVDRVILIIKECFLDKLKLTLEERKEAVVFSSLCDYEQHLLTGTGGHKLTRKYKHYLWKNTNFDFPLWGQKDVWWWHETIKEGEPLTKVGWVLTDSCPVKGENWKIQKLFCKSWTHILCLNCSISHHMSEITREFKTNSRMQLYLAVRLIKYWNYFIVNYTFVK